MKIIDSIRLNHQIQSLNTLTVMCYNKAVRSGKELYRVLKINKDNNKEDSNANR